MALNRYIIERDIPEVGDAGTPAARRGRRQVDEALAELAPDIQWVESYVAADKTFCVYLAKDEDIIRRHAKSAGSRRPK